MTPRRKTVAAVIIAVGAVVYGLSPIDVIPELLTGPLGLADDFAVLIGSGIAIWKLLSGGRQRPAAGQGKPADFAG
jgi:uncharacterized membrane protein YkvA (DUF1232 family)